MRIRFLSGFAVALLLLSCQKERSWEDGTVPGSTLVKVVTKVSNTDSTITTYGYDNKTYTSQNVIGDDYLFNGNDVEITRNSEGIIQKIQVSEPGGDDFLYMVNYNTSTKQYTSKVATYKVQNATYKDSIAYKYNASGKIIEELAFTDDGATGGYVEIGKYEYSYDGSGSLLTIKDYYYDPSTGEFEGISEVAFAYDSKVNPLILNTEAILVDDVLFNSNHNVVKVSINNFADPTYNETIDFVYTYDALDKPVSAEVTFASIGAPVPVYFYYQ